MTTEIWRDFDPNLTIPVGLKNARVATSPTVTKDLPEPDADIDIQTETDEDDNSLLNEDEIDDELGVPGSADIISQTVRTTPAGNQVVDVVLDIDGIDGSVKYEIRITK